MNFASHTEWKSHHWLVSPPNLHTSCSAEKELHYQLVQWIIVKCQYSPHKSLRWLWFYWQPPESPRQVSAWARKCSVTNFIAITPLNLTSTLAPRKITWLGWQNYTQIRIPRCQTSADVIWATRQLFCRIDWFPGKWNRKSTSGMSKGNWVAILWLPFGNVGCTIDFAVTTSETGIVQVCS